MKKVNGKNQAIMFDAISKDILKALPNPSEGAYEIKVKIPEFTFLGVNGQPDFATIYMTFYPSDNIIELKSLKEYVYQLRNIVVSYIETIHSRLTFMLNPEQDEAYLDYMAKHYGFESIKQDSKSKPATKNPLKNLKNNL